MWIWATFWANLQSYGPQRGRYLTFANCICLFSGVVLAMDIDGGIPGPRTLESLALINNSAGMSIIGAGRLEFPTMINFSIFDRNSDPIFYCESNFFVENCQFVGGPITWYDETGVVNGNVEYAIGDMTITLTRSNLCYVIRAPKPSPTCSETPRPSSTEFSASPLSETS
jgi:hypothetical protein